MAIFGGPPVSLRVRGTELAKVDDATLASLDEAEREVVRAHLAASEARLATRKAQFEYERVAARQAGAKADVSLAKAERHAARAHADGRAAYDAEQAIGAARTGKDVLDQQIAWLRAELAAAEAREAEADAAGWAAEAFLELQRARLLARDPSDAHFQGFVKQDARCRSALETARHRAALARAEAENRKNVWQLAAERTLETL